jgi:hypothetical protein
MLIFIILASRNLSTTDWCVLLVDFDKDLRYNRSQVKYFPAFTDASFEELDWLYGFIPYVDDGLMLNLELWMDTPGAIMSVTVNMDMLCRNSIWMYWNLDGVLLLSLRWKLMVSLSYIVWK